MLALDDPIWNRLQHWYGDAADMPSLIKNAESCDENLHEFWPELSNRLVHQCCVSDSAIAAFPYFVSIASNNTGTIKGVLSIHLAGWILVLALRKQEWFAKLPTEITSPFQEFVPIGRTVAAEIYKKRTPTNLSGELDFLATMAAFDGNIEAYGILAAWYSGEISCPHCDHAISLDDISPY